jgi:hypothetical protein
LADVTVVLDVGAWSSIHVPPLIVSPSASRKYRLETWKQSPVALTTVLAGRDESHACIAVSTFVVEQSCCEMEEGTGTPGTKGVVSPPAAAKGSAATHKAAAMSGANRRISFVATPARRRPHPRT